MTVQGININWDILSKEAWQCRENAHLYGKTKVGAALLTSNNNIFTGCNVEHQFRSHDVHAEVNAISNMVTKGDINILAIIIVAERERFTPCGSCMDWIFQFGNHDCLVAFQGKKDGEITIYTAHDLMPHYPY